MRESASTDLREPQGSNPLGPPGPELCPRNSDPGIPSYDLADKLAGRAEPIWATRKQKLATANAQRRARSEKEGFARSQCSGVR